MLLLFKVIAFFFRSTLNYILKYSTNPSRTCAPSKKPIGIILKINKNPLMYRVAARICSVLVESSIGLNLMRNQQINHNTRLRNGPANATATVCNGVAAPVCVTYPGTKKIKPVLSNFNTIPTESQRYAA